MVWDSSWFVRTGEAQGLRQVRHKQEPPGSLQWRSLPPGYNSQAALVHAAVHAAVQVLFSSPPSSGAAVLRIKLAPGVEEEGAAAAPAAEPVAA